MGYVVLLVLFSSDLLVLFPFVLFGFYMFFYLLFLSFFFCYGFAIFLGCSV
jgi:hypothetical protein